MLFQLSNTDGYTTACLVVIKFILFIKDQIVDQIEKNIICLYRQIKLTEIATDKGDLSEEMIDDNQQ